MISKLKIARFQLEMSQKQLADKVGITPQYLGKLENGKASNPSKKLMEALAEVLESNVCELFY